MSCRRFDPTCDICGHSILNTICSTPAGESAHYGCSLTYYEPDDTLKGRWRVPTVVRNLNGDELGCGETSTLHSLRETIEAQWEVPLILQRLVCQHCNEDLVEIQRDADYVNDHVSDRGVLTVMLVIRPIDTLEMAALRKDDFAHWLRLALVMVLPKALSGTDAEETARSGQVFKSLEEIQWNRTYTTHRCRVRNCSLPHCYQ